MTNRISVEACFGAIMRAARQLVEDGFILDEDLPRIEEMAQNWGRPRHTLSLLRKRGCWADALHSAKEMPVPPTLR